MKGQFFLIAAILMVISLIMIKGLLGVYSSGETHANMNMNIDDKQLDNINGEYEYAAGMASLTSDPNQTLNQYFSNFSEYIRGEKDFRVLWVTVFVNGTNQKYYLNAGNYIQNKISLNISVTNSTPSGVLMEIPDMTTKSASFDSDINGTINISLRYLIGGIEKENIFQIKISNTSSISSFMDIAIVSSGLKIGTNKLYNANIVG